MTLFETISSEDRARVGIVNDDLAKASLASQAVSTTGLDQLAQELTSGNDILPFGPGTPIPPALPEEAEPRRWDYPVGVNIPIAPRTYEPITFAMLRALARNYDVAQIAIQKRVDGIRKLRWAIRPRPVRGLERKASIERAKGLEAAVSRVSEFLARPDQEHDFADWLAQHLYDLFSIDAATIYLRPTLAGELYGLEVIDGATIRPYIDGYGRPPLPPMPAFGQVIKGITRGMFSREELVYAPFWRRSDSPYGHPPTEWILLTVNRALRRQTQDLTQFTEGTLPIAFLKVARDTPSNQLKELREYLDNLLAGNDVARARVIPIPGGEGTGLDRIIPAPTTEAEEWLMQLTCAAFGVSPTELGFISKGSGLGGKGFAEIQTDVSIQRDLAIAGSVKGRFDRIIAADPPYGLGEPDIEFFWEDLEKQEDRLAEAQALKEYWAIGATTSDWIAENVLDQDPPGLGAVIAFGGSVQTVKDFLAPPEPVPAALAGQEPGGLPDGPPAGAKPGADDEPPDEPPAAMGKRGSDLTRWERKALRAVREGRDPTRFASDEIAAPDAAFLRDALAKASTPADVHAAFGLLKGGASGGPLPETSARTSSESSSPRGSLAKAATWYAGWDWMTPSPSSSPTPATSPGRSSMEAELMGLLRDRLAADERLLPEMAATFRDALAKASTAPPEIRVEVPAPEVHVEVPAPVVMIAEGAVQVHVAAPAPVAPPPAGRRRVERDAAGRITAVLAEEPV